MYSRRPGGEAPLYVCVCVPIYIIYVQLPTRRRSTSLQCASASCFRPRAPPRRAPTCSRPPMARRGSRRRACLALIRGCRTSFSSCSGACVYVCTHTHTHTHTHICVYMNMYIVWLSDLFLVLFRCVRGQEGGVNTKIPNEPGPVSV